MFRWSQNERSRYTESSSYNCHESMTIRVQIADIKWLFGLTSKKQEWLCTLLLQSWIQLLDCLAKSRVLKWLQKWSAKTLAFALAWRIDLSMRSCSETRSWNIEHFLPLKRFLCLSLNENLLLLNLLLHFFHLVPCIWEF